MGNILSKQLQELVDLLTPSNLYPDSDVDSYSPVLDIIETDEEEMFDHLNHLQNVPEEDKHRVPLGITVCMGDLKRSAMRIKPDEPCSLDGKYLILINSSVDKYQQGIALAHELGHIVGFMCGDESEEFAEQWAVERIIALDLDLDEKCKYLSNSNNW